MRPSGFFSRPPGPHIGEGLGILINANAKRGGRRVAAQIKRALPGANVALTKRVEEIDSWLASMGPMRGLFAAGGDGTAIALLNAVGRSSRKGDVVGGLPLGTGNAWAHALGAQHLHMCILALQQWQGPLPSRRYDMLDCDGTTTMFAGSGWDADVLLDYQAIVSEARGPLKRVRKTVYGYVQAMATRTLPKAIMQSRPYAVVETLSDRVFELDQGGDLRRLNVRAGDILYQGSVSTVGAATCPEFGFRFRAYPHAERAPGLMNVRVYDRSAGGALLDIPKLWRGARLTGMRDWFADHIRVTFSRPAALQIAGESVGERTVVDYRSAAHPVAAIDWRGMRAR
jgi:diacylglycerol kinase family enzyme